MKLAYFRMQRANFGDDLNSWLWDDVLPGWREWSPDTTLLGVGTILKEDFAPPGPKLVLGSGTGYGVPPDVTGAEWDIRAVRGPLTCRKLGLPSGLALSDPAILLPGLQRFADIERTGETLFVPHYSADSMLDWEEICRELGIAYQTPVADPVQVIRRIAGADAVIAESMHGAIVADAFGVPWRAVRISAGFNMFKWQDWWASLDDRPLKPQMFFRLLRALQGLTAPLRRMMPKGRGGGGAPGAPGDPQASRHMPWLRPFALSDLRQATSGPFDMSAATVRAANQERWHECLAVVRRDYSDRQP